MSSIINPDAKAIAEYENQALRQHIIDSYETITRNDLNNHLNIPSNIIRNVENHVSGGIVGALLKVWEIYDTMQTSGALVPETVEVKQSMYVSSVTGVNAYGVYAMVDLPSGLPIAVYTGVYVKELLPDQLEQLQYGSAILPICRDDTSSILHLFQTYAATTGSPEASRVANESYYRYITRHHPEFQHDNNYAQNIQHALTSIVQNVEFRWMPGGMYAITLRPIAAGEELLASVYNRCFKFV